MMRNNGWKHLSIKTALLMSLLMVPVTTGCSAQKSALTPKNPTTITVWNYYTGAQLEQFNALVQEFNSTEGKDRGIIVESYSEGMITDLTDAVMAAARKEVGASDLPNIFAAYSDTVQELDEMGVIADLKDQLTDKEWAEYIDSYVAEGDIEHDGSVKIFPIAKATEILMLNKTDWDIFAEKTGVTLDDLSTIEGVTKTAEIYYNYVDDKTPTKEDDGKAFFGRDAIANYMIIGSKQLGHDLVSVDENNQIVIDFPEDVARKLWDNYYVPFVNGYFGAVGRFRSDDVKTGNALCFVGSSSSASFFPKEVILSDSQKYPIETAVLEAPKFEGGEDYAVQQGAGMAVTTGTDAQIEASVAFLRWFTQPDNNIRFSLGSGYLPVTKEANKLERVEEVASAGDITESVEKSLETVNNNTLYTVVGDDGGTRVLLYNIEDQANADREKVVEMMDGGMSRKDAVAQFTTDEHFEEWYRQMKDALESAASK